MIPKKLVTRPQYLEKLLQFKDTDLIKVVTGVRRCGKSSLLDLARAAIESEAVPGRSFATLNLESKENPVKTEDDLYNYFKKQARPDTHLYIFLDEPQRIKNWQNAVNAMRVDFNCDIYLTGSNAYLLSSELSTYLSGRYVETKMLPLTLAEYLDFCGLSFAEGSSVTLGADGTPVLFDDILSRYMLFGGMPALASLDTTQAQHDAYMAALYDAVATRDILNRERAREESRVTNPVLLRKIVNYLADNIGKESSPTNIANCLVSAGDKTTNKTVASYLAALNDAYLLYQASRYDLRGKDILKTNPKEYIVDTGLRSYIMGYRRIDSGFVFENMVFLQLLHDGWRVHAGKLYNKEIDFVAIKDGTLLYIQVAENLTEESTRKREIEPLLAIRDAYPKMIVVRQGAYDSDINGVRIISAQDFFLNGNQRFLS